jgi:hypothetical protein
MTFNYIYPFYLKKITYLILLFFIYIYSFSQIISYELIESWTLEDVQDIYDSNSFPENTGQINFEVDGYKILYLTPNHNGNLVLCSGAIYLPKATTCPTPVLSWQHGTAVKDSAAPSNMKSNNKRIGVIGASHGYIVTMSDFIGLGEGIGFHNYVHADTEASSIIDLIIFGKDFAYDKGVMPSEQLFLMGYSQGGHATMAAVKEIQENDSLNIQVTGSVPMAGPYSMSEAQTDMLNNAIEYPNPGYLPYVLFGYHNIYNLFSNINDVLIEPYSQYLFSMYSGEYNMTEINETLPVNPIDIFQPQYYEDFLTTENHPFKLALIDNDVYNFIPESPMRLIHCNGDDNVTYENSIIAFNYFINGGSTDVELWDGGNFDHSTCAFFAIIGAKIWIDSLSEICEPYISDISNLHKPSKQLIYASDILGRKTNEFAHLKINIYNDGSVEKEYILD